MMGRGHEHWHPSPEFYYQPGGGPMLDMGPYYLTALLNLLGPVKRLSGIAKQTYDTRTILSKPKRGTVMNVSTPDHYVGVIEFADGCSGTIVQSFSMRAAHYDGARPITIFGTEGTLRVPDPNGFDGVPQLAAHTEDGKDEFVDVPHAFVPGYGRSVGLADMAAAIRTGRPHRCSLEQAFCVLDLMIGFRDASDTGRQYEPALPYERPPAMDPSLPYGTV
jgi:predicted dehydrogenase